MHTADGRADGERRLLGRSRALPVTLALLLALALAACSTSTDAGAAADAAAQSTASSSATASGADAGSEDDAAAASAEDDGDSAAEAEDAAAAAETAIEDEDQAAAATEAEAATATEAEAADPIAALAAETLNPDGVPVSEGLPYEGMDEQFIDYTWMGPADSSKLLTTGSSAGSTVYAWCARNDTGDRVLSATVTDGVVASLTHWNYYSDYWRDALTLELLDYPDLYATGKRVVPYSSGTASIPTLPDPLDYDDPYEFADDAEDWFEYLGYDDPYDAALRYWDDNGP